MFLGSFPTTGSDDISSGGVITDTHYDDADVVIEDADVPLLPGDQDGDGWGDIGWSDDDRYLVSFPGY
mgnify:CR=1 FL=1